MSSQNSKLGILQLRLLPHSALAYCQQEAGFGGRVMVGFSSFSTQAFFHTLPSTTTTPTPNLDWVVLTCQCCGCRRSALCDIGRCLKLILVSTLLVSFINPPGKNSYLVPLARQMQFSFFSPQALDDTFRLSVLVCTSTWTSCTGSQVTLSWMSYGAHTCFMVNTCTSFGPTNSGHADWTSCSSHSLLFYSFP